MLEAFKELDSRLNPKTKLLMGGGGAMLLAYDFPLATQDIDAIFYKCGIKESDVHDDVVAVATKLGLPMDWLNPYFENFLYTLPPDYESRLKPVFQGANLVVNALSKEDLLVLKCFAGRDKDVGHARALIKKNADVDFVRAHIFTMIDARIPKAQEASDFLDDLLDELEG